MSDANGVLKTFVSNSVVFSSLGKHFFSTKYESRTKTPSVALIVYDTSLTFSREVKCIWKRKFSAVTVLYVLQRYVVIAALVAKLPWSSSQFPVFTGIQVQGCILDLCDVHDSQHDLYRTHFTPPSLGYLSTALVTRHLYRTSGAIFAVHKHIPPLTRAAVITTDILIVFFIWYKTVDSWTLRDIRFKGASGPLLTTVLIQNGTIYFVVLTALNIVTLVMDKVPTVGVYGGLYSYVGSAISANLSARFFLDLRMVYFQRADPNFPTMASSVRFAGASIIGNIGAPMSFEDSAWVMSAGLEAEERPVYSDDPIMAHPAISAVDLGGGDDADVAREGA
ncbi:hypothetical protein BXZ70DRAFT_1055738 [Cristinia sonorae]|uniref:DUF6533 domain-containing protein n=1 Tax=Cristinia sonorae TaxID=1940300 RepID=A0A8K0UT56_9AGAR|nr:hypothetical protein BXZ70DRAFT_1055738 [Cristinia sonorae]